MNTAHPHIPVLLNEVITAMQPVDGGVYLDGTLGAGGYSEAILNAADCRLVAIDRDKTVFAAVRERLKDAAERVTFIHGQFGDVEDLAKNAGFEEFDAMVVDVGVSSMQLDRAERGFSFRQDGPLDMRMDQNSDGQTAADIVNTYEEQDLANIIYRYGDERKSRRIARAIIEKRKDQPITTTFALADIVRSVVHKSPKDKNDPATKTFQALRIEVNKELEELQRFLQASELLLKPGGRLVVVAFHSLEDGLVKRFLLEKSGQQARQSRHVPEIHVESRPSFDLSSKKSIKPTEAEISANPRSRSARLRFATRTSIVSEKAKEAS